MEGIIKRSNRMKIPDYGIHNDEMIRGFFGEYRFLSNFWDAPVYYERLWYPRIENAYQAAKTKQISEREAFVTLSAKDVKRAGNKVELRSDWEKVKYDIMSALVFDKFFRNLELRDKLLKTDDKFLEETNAWHDNIWGKCVCKKCELNKGSNFLGQILMKVREFWK